MKLSKNIEKMERNGLLQHGKLLHGLAENTCTNLSENLL